MNHDQVRRVVRDQVLIRVIFGDGDKVAAGVRLP